MPDIVDTRLRRLYEYWLSKRGGREMPARADLDPIDMAFAIGNVILVDVPDETPPRFFVRLHGTTLSRLVNFDLTGKPLDAMPEPEFRDLSRRSFMKVLRTRQPLHAQADRVLDGRIQRYEAIIMPLSSDGGRIDMLFLGMVYDDPPR